MFSFAYELGDGLLYFTYHFDSVYIPCQIAFANSFLDLIVNGYLVQIKSSQPRLFVFLEIFLSIKKG